ncbi:hypothetical protein [Elizabethkingia argenteiflava]|nr:hypothetical protein [Elizabethkingia argenteiflava]
MIVMDDVRFHKQYIVKIHRGEEGIVSYIDHAMDPDLNSVENNGV